jgi:hypothetical protein
MIIPRNIRSGQLGKISKYHREYDCGEQWLDHSPQWAKNGLLVAGNKVPLNKQKNQVPIFERLFQVQIEKAMLRCDYGFILLCFVHAFPAPE